MLTIARSRENSSDTSSFMNASIIFRDPNVDPATYPDVSFCINTYQKIARESSHVGDLILRPVNLFFETMTIQEHKKLYDFYKYTKMIIPGITKENLREVQETLQNKIMDVILKMKIPERLINFCRTPIFEYPDFEGIGNKPHHSQEKTYDLDNYVDLTALGLLSKIMVPVWGELVEVLGDIGIDNNQREKIAFDLLEPTLLESSFDQIYKKLTFSLKASIADDRKTLDKNPIGNTTTSYVLTHNGLDDEMFNAIVMANIIMKRMAIYECLTRLEDGSIPNAMAYIYDGIKKTADTRMRSMRQRISTMPRRELPNYEKEDNNSILDHSSVPSKKTFDVPIVIALGAERWELPRLLKDTNTDIEVFEKAVDYYRENYFDVSYLTQAVVASFVGTRFGGSKCLNYLHPSTYQKVVTIVQMFLIKQNMTDLAMMISSITSKDIVDGGNPNIGMRMSSNMKNTPEYLECLNLFKGSLRKTAYTFGRTDTSKKPELVTINFANHIEKMSEWIIQYSHVENMAPALWEMSGITDKPVMGRECMFDENIVRNLCRFYLMMRGDNRPF